MGKHFCCKTTDGYEIFYTDEEEKNFKENCKAVRNSRVTILKEDLGKIEAEIISLRRLKSKAVALLKKKNSIIKELIFNVEKNEDLLFKIKNLQARGDSYKEAYNDYQRQTEENFDKEVKRKVACVLESINNGNLIIEMANVIKNEQKKNAVLEAENLQLREKIRELEGKFNRYVPGRKERGELKMEFENYVFAVMMENSDEVVYCVYEDKEEAEKFIKRNFGKGEAWVEEVPFVKKIVKEDKMEAIGLLTQIKLSYKEQIKRLREENEKLRDGEILLKTRIRNLEEENKERKGEIDQLKSLVNSKSDYILELKSDNRKLKADNEKLRKKI